MPISEDEAAIVRFMLRREGDAPQMTVEHVRDFRDDGIPSVHQRLLGTALYAEGDEPQEVPQTVSRGGLGLRHQGKAPVLRLDDYLSFVLFTEYPGDRPALFPNTTSEGIILVYDDADRDSFESIAWFAEQLKINGPISPPAYRTDKGWVFPPTPTPPRGHGSSSGIASINPRPLGKPNDGSFVDPELRALLDQVPTPSFPITVVARESSGGAPDAQKVPRADGEALASKINADFYTLSTEYAATIEEWKVPHPAVTDMADRILVRRACGFDEGRPLLNPNEAAYVQRWRSTFPLRDEEERAPESSFRSLVRYMMERVPWLSRIPR